MKIKETDKPLKISAPNLGPANHKLLFSSSNNVGIPSLRKTGISALPTNLVRYRKRFRTNGKMKQLNQMGVHFFAEDRDIEVVWNTPHKPLDYLSQFKSVLTPDFSLYRDWPMVMQMWNVYRARWVGCFWQSKGFSVIPTISWSTQASWEFAFEGVATGSLVAVSAIGIKRHDLTQVLMFTEGFKEMVEHIDPCGVIVSGALLEGCAEMVQVYPFDSLWDDARLQIKGKKAPTINGNKGMNANGHN